MNFTDKQNEFLCKCIGVSILVISFGFVLSMCLHWPKGFRSGVFNKLSDIAIIQQNNSDGIDSLNYTFKKLIKQLESRTGFKYNAEER